MTDNIEIRKDDYTMAKELCLAAGLPLQRIRPGALDLMSDNIAATLGKAAALQATTIQRRRSQKLAELFRAAETFRAACASYVVTMDIADPSEPSNEQ